MEFRFQGTLLSDDTYRNCAFVGCFCFFLYFSCLLVCCVSSSISKFLVLGVYHEGPFHFSIYSKLGGALAGKYNLLYCLGQNPAAAKNIDTSRFWVIFENSQKCRQIIGAHRRSIFHAAKSSQMPYTAKIQKINNFNNKIKNSLERRLVAGAGRCWHNPSTCWQMLT